MPSPPSPDPQVRPRPLFDLQSHPASSDTCFFSSYLLVASSSFKNHLTLGKNTPPADALPVCAEGPRPASRSARPAFDGHIPLHQSGTPAQNLTAERLEKTHGGHK